MSPETGPAHSVSIAVGDAGEHRTAMTLSACQLEKIAEELMSLKLQSLFPRPWLSLALIALILATRSHHFGTAFSPPDATLAAFLLAGLWVPSTILFGGLLAVTALADQVAFANGVSAWCVTAAYVFLIPTYGVMWYAGRQLRNVDFLSVAGSARLAIALVLSSALAFVISSGSFFLFSGYFPNMSALEYTSRVLKYVPPYMGWASAYVIGAIVLSLIYTTRRSLAVASR